MAVAELDIPQLSSFCSLPQVSINTLLSAPTAEVVRTLLQHISSKVQEYNELQSEKLRSGVEREAAIRGQETKNRALKAQIEKYHKESAELRLNLQAQGVSSNLSTGISFTRLSKSPENASASVEADLHILRSSATTSISEINSLKSRIDSLETSNRTTLSLLDSKSKAHDDLASELSAQHQKKIEVRKQVSELEQALDSERTAHSSAKYREEGQKQTITQLERNNDWLNIELKTKVSEHTRLRKEKNQRIADLQRQEEEHTTTIQTLQRNEANLRRTLDEVSNKAEERSQRIQRAQEEIAQKEQAYQVELDAANRLAKLRQNSAATERDRAQDLSDQLEGVKEQASAEIGKLSAELETERNDRAATEGKVAELEVQVERLEGELAAVHEQENAPGTPHKAVNGFSGSSPARGDSTPQMFSPSLSGVKGNLSKTQLYSENQQLKREIGSLKGAWDDLLRDLELKEPEVEEMRMENTRLDSEIADLSSLVDTVCKERDQAVKAARKQEGQAEAKIKEGEVLRQQLRDLSSQIKMLLMEAHLHEQQQEDLSLNGRAQLERLAHSSQEEEVAEGLSDTDKYISANLVTFRNVVELQEQNGKLLKVTREIGERMEHEESLRKQTEAARNWDELQSKYERCKDEIKSLVTQSQSYIKERDMFRRMLSHRGQLPAGSETQSLFGESVNGDGPSDASEQANVMDSIENSTSAKDVSDYARLFKDMQTHFDSYRNEAATDQATLKVQVDELSKANSELRSEAIRSNSQVTLAHERYEMLQANYTMLKSENAELQKRSQSFYEGAAKQDLRIQQAAEDLIEARGLIDSMRNENANLKAEKEFWKSVERRLTDDNESLMNERGRLNSLNVSLESLRNEREHMEKETRRKLQNRVDNLESELQRTATSLREETEENKRSISRREYEHEQSQKRIDDLISSLSALREELATANTAKDHLSRHVDELKIELRSAKERLDVLRSVSAAPNTSTAGPNSASMSGAEDSNLSQEQKLGVRVSELQRDLDLAKSELEDVKGQVEQYKAISQSSEEELSSLNQTLEMYQQETNRLVEKKDSNIKQLEQRVEDISSELAFTNTELVGFRNQQADHDRKIDEQRKQYEIRIAQLKDEDDRHAAAAQYYQQDLKDQVVITKQAQDNYENELVKHAEAARALQKMRGELNEVKTEIVEARTDAETARLNLSQSEESWTDSKERFEREITELRTARQDLRSQNDHLHQQLETLTNIRKHATNGEEHVLEVSQPTGLDHFQEVIKYLRREKEIVEVQLEVSSGEAKRVKQQLDYTQSQLDDARLKLNQQRRTEEQSERSTLDHNKLIETVHDLNTLRESNVTLRVESRQAQAALETRSKEVEELKAQVEPLQTEILDLKGEREAQGDEAKLLKENADRWQQRAQNVLQKYDRVDPAEVEALKEQVKTLESHRDELVSSKQALQEQLDNVSEQLNQVQEQGNEQLASQKARLTEQFKGRSKTLSDRIKEKDAALQTAMNERQGLEDRLLGLSDLQTQLDSARAERDAAVEKAIPENVVAESTYQNEGEEGEVNETHNQESTQATIHAEQTKFEAAEAKANEEASRSSGLRGELADSRARIDELEAQIVQLQATIGASPITLNQLGASPQPQADLLPHDEMINKLREDLAQAKKDVDDMRVSGPVSVTILGGSTEHESKSVADQVAEHAEAVQKELERRHDQRVKENDDSFQKKVEAMRAQLTKKLSDGKTQIRVSLTAEHEQAMQGLKAEHAREMDAIHARHKDELNELQKHEESRFTELRATWEQEHQAQASVDATVAKCDQQISGPPWQPTEQEARDFVQSNDVVKGILRKNVINQVNKAKTDLSASLKEEHERSLTERLAEAQEKANMAKDHAIMMEAKKTAVQINMANNQKRLLQFRLEIVQKAAQDSPQKPVKEVWDIAKDAKPPQGPTTLQATQPAPKPSAAPVGKPGQTDPSIQNNHTGPPAQARSAQTNAQGATPTATVFGRPTPIGQSSQPQSDQSRQQLEGKMAPTQSSSSTANPFQRPATSGIPQKQLQSVMNQSTSGTGPTALKSLQSGLPIARGGANRGSFRGKGASVGRGGPGIDTSRAQEHSQGRGSPNSAGLNVGAKQFVPGNKRPREDSQDVPKGGDGPEKRIRGGGAGS